ncbi:MAG: hypothetical protein ACT4NP_15875 [Pseudonocardiales bacterium]
MPHTRLDTFIERLNGVPHGVRQARPWPAAPGVGQRGGQAIDEHSQVGSSLLRVGDLLTDEGLQVAGDGALRGKQPGGKQPDPL